ncbi:N-acetyl-D-glucosamine kinase [Cylas formicarius]|uniref:N-acetyl-D-glucosamine kinase n=1 Tax=Cylas formicarius TaxID=197179 RepID=UPI0029588194|nr:N-acetyl-D-glucosamine kinase [Cylas formicarius]
MCSLIGGIEGGATHSHAVILSAAGELVSVAQGPTTNYHLIGMTECRKRIADLITEAKRNAGIAPDVPLEALGLGLSGCELEESNVELQKGLERNYPLLSRRYAIGSDTEGSLAAVSNRGGVTCIAGTGSNTLLINPDGGKFQCRGWGHMLGDEGSAWHISWRAIKYCFDDLDRFEDAPHPIDAVWNLVRDHFRIKTQRDILDSFYKNFDKAFVASLCKRLADVARGGDPLAAAVFREAGRHLAKSVASVAARAAPELTSREGGLHVLCVGSVWLSWDLLRDGFVDCLRSEGRPPAGPLSLLRLTTEMGIGSALMAADRLGLRLDRDYTKNFHVFYVYNDEAN